MKVSKKVLSVFMAVLMVITSVSVGLTALAAGNPYEELADALRSENVANASYGQSGYMTTVTDGTGDIEKAANAFWAVAETVAVVGNNGKDTNASQPWSAAGVAKRIKTELGNYMTAEELSVYKVSAVIDKFVGGMTGNNYSAYGTFSSGTNPGARTYGLVITRSPAQVLLYPSIADIPDPLNTTVTYSWSHGVGQESSGGLFKRYSYWNYLNGMSRTESNPDTTTKAALTTFGDYFSDEKLATEFSAMTQLSLIHI